MSVEIHVPEMGESIAEVRLGQWLKADGEWVERDDLLVEIESDKETMFQAKTLLQAWNRSAVLTNEINSAIETRQFKTPKQRPDPPRPAAARRRPEHL